MTPIIITPRGIRSVATPKPAITKPVIVNPAPTRVLPQSVVTPAPPAQVEPVRRASTPLLIKSSVRNILERRPGTQPRVPDRIVPRDFAEGAVIEVCLRRAFGPGHGIGQMLVRRPHENSLAPWEVLDLWVPESLDISPRDCSKPTDSSLFKLTCAKCGVFKYRILEVAVSTVQCPIAHECTLLGQPISDRFRFMPSWVKLLCAEEIRQRIQMFTGHEFPDPILHGQSLVSEPTPEELRQSQLHRHEIRQKSAHQRDDAQQSSSRYVQHIGQPIINGVFDSLDANKVKEVLHLDPDHDSEVISRKQRRAAQKRLRNLSKEVLEED